MDKLKRFDNQREKRAEEAMEARGRGQCEGGSNKRSKYPTNNERGSTREVAKVNRAILPECRPNVAWH